jgi:hypothetical protein
MIPVPIGVGTPRRNTCIRLARRVHRARRVDSARPGRALVVEALIRFDGLDPTQSALAFGLLVNQPLHDAPEASRAWEIER